jgi:hypothetical protein
MPKELTETEVNVAHATREVLLKFERAKILKVYFSRLDGRIPTHIPGDLQELYAIDLASIKTFLLGQHPQDSLLHKIFRIMN